MHERHSVLPARGAVRGPLVVPRDMMEHDRNYLLLPRFSKGVFKWMGSCLTKDYFLGHRVGNPSKVSKDSPLDFFKLIHSQSAIRCTGLHSLIQTLVEKENS
jgi:hypothetical protein